MQGGAVLITGAARRIGAAIARQLHGAGARVIVHCHRSRADADRLAAELNGRRGETCAVLSADLLDPEALPRLVEEAHAAFGRLDALVNNASTFRPTPVGSTGAEAWNDLLGTNLRAPFFLTQAAAPWLRLQRGAVVNIVDVHAERPLLDHAAYCAAKAGLVSLTRSFARELGPEVRVNAVAPGAILWPEVDGQFPAPERERIVAQTPLGRIGTPEDVAGAVKYLLFDAPFLTGQVLAVDGGRSVHF